MQRPAATAATATRTQPKATHAAAIDRPASPSVSSLAAPSLNSIEPGVPSLVASPSFSSIPFPSVSSANYPSLTRDDHHLRDALEDGREEGELALEPNMSELTIRGFVPSAPSFDEGQQTSLLRDVGRNASEQEGYQQDRRMHEISYGGAPLAMMHQQQHQQQFHPHQQPVQHLRQPPSSAHIHQPHLHPVTVAARSALDEATAAQERLAYLRSKAIRAEGREALDELDAPPKPVTHILHTVQEGDDLTALAVSYGCSESQIRSLNREIVFATLDNVVGKPIRIPATRNFDPAQRTVDAAARAEEAKANRRFHAVRAFQARTKCTESESTFYLEEHEYVVKDAIEAWEGDVAWEDAQKKATGKKGGNGPPAARMPKASASSGSGSESSYVAPQVRPAPGSINQSSGLGLHRLNR